MAARNMILRDFQEADNSDQQNEDREPVSRVAETERGSDSGKGGEPLQADRRPGDGPQFDRRQGEDRDGADAAAMQPNERRPWMSCERFSRLRRTGAWLFRAVQWRD